MSSPVYVTPDQLRVGMFVILELSWLKHPFTFSSFVVQNEEDLATIRGLGLERVRVDPLRSKLTTEVPATPRTSPPVADSAAQDARSAAISAEKTLRVEQNRALRSDMAQAEQHAVKAAQLVRHTTKQIFSEPEKAIAGTRTLINDVAESLLRDSDTMVHLLNDNVAGEEVYYHSLNVAMLALLLGKAMEFDAAMLETIGMAAIYHDLGKEEIPSRVLLKSGPLTHAEEELLRAHCETGAAAALRAGLPPAVVAGILQHHENLDGSGYPKRLAADHIGTVARVVAIVNHYDNLCNPVNVAAGLTPYEALSTMFAKRKGWFDPAMLGKLVRILGVYPPGSIVKLSSGATGMVISVNSARPLRPLVLVHDPSVPKAEAIILDLETFPAISISKALRPASLAPSVYEYLSPRHRVTYYFGDEKRGA